MIMCKWENLPEEMQTDEVKYYYDILKKKSLSLFFKRFFDVVASFIFLLILSPVFLVLAILIKFDSDGPVFYRQVRITQYGRSFRIHKFRSMVVDADKYSQVTVNNDSRITKIGSKIRKYRLDEICQLIDVFCGDMTFVATRPEVPKYVNSYTSDMIATLLLPAGVTSEASIYYKNEAELLNKSSNTDKIYLEEILPVKMYYNLKEMENFSFWHDIKVMFMTLFAMLGKEYKGKYEEKPNREKSEIK